MKPGMNWREDYEYQRNASQKGIEWRISTQDARIKLSSHFPKINGD